jgi:sulfite reductase (NADPH) flavoprotein alpha-component
MLSLTQTGLPHSPEQEEKVYVQHKLVEYGDKVSDWLSDEKGGYLYVCGSVPSSPLDIPRI